MKEIFQEYGGILITVVAILSIILVVTAVIGSDATGIVGKTFSDLITNFSNHANMSVKKEVVHGAWKRIFWTALEFCCQQRDNGYRL